VGELEQQYGDRIQFTIIPAEETALRNDEIVEFGFVDQRHGLVIFSSEGEAVFFLPGHTYGKPEIDAGIQEVLAAE
jgi:hypothetical protein